MDNQRCVLAEVAAGREWMVRLAFVDKYPDAILFRDRWRADPAPSVGSRASVPVESLPKRLVTKWLNPGGGNEWNIVSEVRVTAITFAKAFHPRSPVHRRLPLALVLGAVAATGGSCNALALPSCEGTYAATSLQQLPQHVVLGLDIHDRSPTNLKLAERFLAGIRSVGVTVGPDPNVLLHVTASVLGGDGAATNKARRAVLSRSARSRRRPVSGAATDAEFQSYQSEPAARRGDIVPARGCDRRAGAARRLGGVAAVPDGRHRQRCARRGHRQGGRRHARHAGRSPPALIAGAQPVFASIS